VIGAAKVVATVAVKRMKSDLGFTFELRLRVCWHARHVLISLKQNSQAGESAKLPTAGGATQQQHSFASSPCARNLNQCFTSDLLELLLEVGWFIWPYPKNRIRNQ